MSNVKIQLNTKGEREDIINYKKQKILNDIKIQKSLIYNRKQQLYGNNFEKYIIDANEKEENNNEIYYKKNIRKTESKINRKNLMSIQNELENLKLIIDERNKILVSNKNCININKFIINNNADIITNSNSKENFSNLTNKYNLINLYNADEDYYNYYFYDDKSYLNKNNINNNEKKQGIQTNKEIIKSYNSKNNSSSKKKVQINSDIDIIKYNKGKSLSFNLGNNTKNLNKKYKMKGILRNKKENIKMIPKPENSRNSENNINNNININISKLYLFPKSFN
jgi:hypothetical protein